MYTQGNWFARKVGNYRGQWDEQPTISTTSLPEADSGTAYSQQLQGGPGTWSASGLPTGWSISSSGVLSKTGATAAVTVTPVFTVTAASGRTASRGIQLVTNASGAKVGEDAMPDATQGSTYSHSIPLSGAGTMTATILGSIPGLAISSSGVVTGTPSAPGDFQVLVTPVSSVSGAGAPHPVKLHVVALDVVAAAVTPRWISDRPGAGPFSKRRNR